MTDQSKSLSKLKRSKVLHVSSLMATASFSLAACSQPAPTPSASSGQEGQWEETSKSFQTIEACVASGEAAADCETAQKLASDEAAANAPRFGTQADCEGEFGAGQCEEKSGGGGGSFFMPMMAGFLLARMMNGNRMGAQPLYRDCRNPRPDGSCGTRTGGAGAFGRTFAGNGNTRAAAPDSRRSQVTRGGFGGSRSSYGG